MHSSTERSVGTHMFVKSIDLLDNEYVRKAGS
jgi:hypothetical protein